MYSRFNADDYTYEIVGSKGEIICKTNTKEEADKIIRERQHEN